MMHKLTLIVVLVLLGLSHLSTAQRTRGGRNGGRVGNLLGGNGGLAGNLLGGAGGQNLVGGLLGGAGGAGLVGGLAGGLMGGAGGANNNGGDSPLNTILETARTINEARQTVTEVKETVTGAIDTVSEKVSGVKDTLSDAASSAKDKISSLFSSDSPADAAMADNQEEFTSFSEDQFGFQDQLDAAFVDFEDDSFHQGQPDNIHDAAFADFEGEGDEFHDAAFADFEGEGEGDEFHDAAFAENADDNFASFDEEELAELAFALGDESFYDNAAADAGTSLQSTASSETPTWAVGLIVLGALVLIALIVVQVQLLLLRKKSVEAVM